MRACVVVSGCFMCRVFLCGSTAVMCRGESSWAIVSLWHNWGADVAVSVVGHPRSPLYSFVYGGRGVLLGGVRDDGENFAGLGSCQCVLWLGLERRLPCVRLSSYSLLCGKQGGEDNLNKLKGWIDDERPVSPLRGGSGGSFLRPLISGQV